MNEDLDPKLRALFAEQHATLSPDEFVAKFKPAADRLHRWLVVRRLVLVALLGLCAIPLQDLALQLAQILMVQLVHLEGGLVSALLAPINSVGMLLSSALFALRAVHRRLFVRH